MFERFTDKARRIVVLAQEEARMLNHNYIGTEHILLGLIHEGEGVAAKALESLGISLSAVRQRVEEKIGQGEHSQSGHIPFTPRAKKVLELSLREAQRLGHNYIGTEHILLGLIREGEGVGAQVLMDLGADLTRVREKVTQLLHESRGDEPGALQVQRPGPIRPIEIAERLDLIAGRLAAIERRLGIQPEPVPRELRELDAEIAAVRREKEIAIDAQDFETASVLRDKDDELVAQRRAKAQQLAAAAPGSEPGEPGEPEGSSESGTSGSASTDVVAAVDEADRLRAEVGRLRALLREHGVDPGESAA
jgi:ATP-dependent Clp protease ATP-binding subunit ClpA